MVNDKILMGCMAVGAGIALSITAAPSANATPLGYLHRLAELGYIGPDAKFLAIGEFVCDGQNDYSDEILARTIVNNTGSGIYMPEGYEIIAIARDELCPSGYMV